MESNQIEFEVSMTKDFLDFLVEMKAEGIGTANELIEVLEDMVSKAYVKPPLLEQLQAYLEVLNNMNEVGMRDAGEIITFMSGMYIEQTSGDLYKNE